jgi:hypothetical protein
VSRRVAIGKRLPRLSIDRPRTIVNLSAVLVAALIAAFALTVEGGSASGSSRPLNLPTLAPPEPPPLLLRDVSRDDAVAINQRIPFSAEKNFAAKPFKFRGDEQTQARALTCLAMAVYYEAGSEDGEGQKAVAQVVLNRVRHPAFPASICGVVFEGFARSTGCQFSFTCDGSLVRNPDRKGWELARQVADAALHGAVFKPVGLATHYHANYVVPYWATSLSKNAQVGLHIFYRWPEGWGAPSAFRRKYLANELDPTSLRVAAISREDHWTGGPLAPDPTIELAADPRIELLAVVQMLATGGSELGAGDERYEKDVRNYFYYQRDHRAVQLFKKLSQADDAFATNAAQLLLSLSPPPELAAKDSSDAPNVGDKDLAEFADALSDFAQQSEFQKFFDGHKPFYGSAVRRTEQSAGLARAYWHAYTGLPLPARKLVLSSLAFQQGAGSCAASDPASPSHILSLGSVATDGPLETFLSTEGVRPLLGPSGLRKASLSMSDPALQEQVVRAVFARIAALTDGEKAGAAAVKRELNAGYTSVPELYDQLRFYESNRARFATLSDFAPELLAKGGRTVVSAPATASASDEQPAKRCGPSAVAAAEQPPAQQSRGS